MTVILGARINRIIGYTGYPIAYYVCILPIMAEDPQKNQLIPPIRKGSGGIINRKQSEYSDVPRGQHPGP